MQPWQREKDDEVTDFGWRKIVVKHFILPDGKTGDFVTDTWGHDSAVVVALDTDGMVIVAKQFRAGPERTMFELPGGGCEPGENPADAARRELGEETGYVSDNELLYLGKGNLTGYHMDTMYYYLLTDCYRSGGKKLDDSEFTHVELKTFDNMLKYAREAMTSDAAALFMAHDTIKTMEEKNDKSS